MQEDSKLFNDNVGKIIERNSDELITPKVQNLYAWWSSFEPNIPLRNDFDIIDHACMAANIFFLEVISIGSYRYKVCGEEVTQIVGGNNSGKVFTYIAEPADQKDEQCNELVSYYDKIIADRCCKTCNGHFTITNKYIRNFESIDCPLTNEQGKITHIVGVIDLLPTNA